MPKPKNKKISDEDIDIKESESSLAEFTKRPLPSENEVEKFDEMMNKEAANIEEDSRVYEDPEIEEEMDESLNEIYQDDDGTMVNVKKLDIKRKHGFLYWILMPLIIIILLGGSGYAAYRYLYLQPGSDPTAVSLTIEGNTDVSAGQEYFYTVYYKNNSNIELTNAALEITYPENYIFLDSSPAGQSNNGLWQIGTIPAQFTGNIKIKGKMIGPVGTTGIITATLRYVPRNFSSEFKKEATLTSTVNDIGLAFDFDYVSSTLVGEQNTLTIHFHPQNNNYINNFRVAVDPKENMDFIDTQNSVDNLATNTEVRPGVFDVSVGANTGTGTIDQVLPVNYKFTDKVNDHEELDIHFEELGNDNKYYEFYTKKLDIEVMKSDLNLTLIINGSREDQGVNFGDTLHYTISYTNKGETAMKDVVIMAVLDSNFLDGTTLNDPNKGQEKGNTITWTKDEIPQLAELKTNDQGNIDFSIQVSKAGEIDPQQDYEITSYAQYSIGNKSDFSQNLDNRSNTIVNKINSNLKLDEQVRYFSQDNIPVGTGPNPPQVGQTTTYKVYWELTNDLHELHDASVSVKLPDNVTWNQKNQATVGTVDFDQGTHTVTWAIGRLPITVFKADAEFSIAVTPTESNRNTIMVLLPGTKVSAVDSDTNATLTDTLKAETTKLEGDAIGASDGIVK